MEQDTAKELKTCSELIGVDLDDVLADYIYSLFSYHNANYRTNFTRDDLKNWYLSSLWGCSSDEAVKRVIEFQNSHHFKNISQFNGSSDALNKLSLSHRLVIITARTLEFSSQTHDWVEENYPDIFEGIYFTSHFGPNPKRKSDICNKLGVTVFIDDSVENVVDVLTNTPDHLQQRRKVLIMDNPWNREVMPSGIIRVHSWQEALTIIEQPR